MSVERSDLTYEYAVKTYNDAQKLKHESKTFDYKSVEHFGRTWIVPREQFVVATFECLMDLIDNFVISLFKSAFAGIRGEFKDEKLNAQTVYSWKNTGYCARMSLICFLGIFAPRLVEGANKKAEEFSAWIKKKMENNEPDLTQKNYNPKPLEI